MFISIDIGGTNTRIALAKDLSGDLAPFTYSTNLPIERFPSPETLANLQISIIQAIKKHTPLNEIKGICLGVAGPVDQKKQKLVFGTNIKALGGDLSVKEILGTELSNLPLPILFHNDAELAALAEANIGAGKGYTTVAYITLSTGVGGAYTVNGKLPGKRFNPEPGHHIIEIGGREGASTKITGEWEAYSSGIAFEDLYKESPVEANNTSIWEKYSEEVAVGLHNLTCLWQPDIFVLGGGITKKSELFLPSVKKKLAKSLKYVRPVPEFAISNLGDTNGFLGGLIALKNYETS